MNKFLKITCIIIGLSLFCGISSPSYVSADDNMKYQYVQNLQVASTENGYQIWCTIEELLWKDNDMVVYRAKGKQDGKKYIVSINSADFKDYNIDKYKEDFISTIPEIPNLVGRTVTLYGEKVIYKGMESTPYIQVIYILQAPEDIKDSSYVYKTAPCMPDVTTIQGRIFIRNTDVPHICISTPNAIFELWLSSTQKKTFEKLINRYVELKGQVIVREQPYYHYAFEPISVNQINESSLTEPLFGNLIPYYNVNTKVTVQTPNPDSTCKYGNGLLVTFDLTTTEINLK